MICGDGDVENLLLSPPGPQLLLQALQVPQTPHWHSELDGGADGPAGVNIDSYGIDCDSFESSEHLFCFISTLSFITQHPFSLSFSANGEESM